MTDLFARTSRTIARLEDQISAGRARTRDLETRLEVFEAIAREAGGGIAPAAGGYLQVPPALTAAADERGRDAIPVRLDTPAGTVIALVQGGGDPREWWHAIAGPPGQPARRHLRSVPA